MRSLLILIVVLSATSCYDANKAQRESDQRQLDRARGEVQLCNEIGGHPSIETKTDGWSGHVIEVKCETK